MKILITGANGMVAKATAAYCRSIGDEVEALTRAEMDIADRLTVEAKIAEAKPDAVVNCAAYTNVDGAETERQKSLDANVKGVENLAVACKMADCGFVTISTDYVFDGRNTGFYTQRDTPNPLGYYGKTKYDGEKLARDEYARSIIVRSGWIYGSEGTNFLSVVHKLLAEGKAVKTIGDAYGTPTYAGDLALRLRELAELDMPAIYHVTNPGEGTTYFGFAEKVCELGGFDRGLVTAVSSKELNRPAPRPVSSKLACLFSEKFGLEPLPAWEESLKKFISGDQ